MSDEIKFLVLPFSVIALFAAALFIFLYKSTSAYNIAIDAKCSVHQMASKEYSHMVGKTIVGQRLCVDADGRIYDPSNWKD